MSCAGYRSFNEPIDLPLRPITVIFGKNNTGKTTLARLPLFIRESIFTSSEMHAFTYNDLRFGASFRDLANAAQAHPTISYGLQLGSGAFLRVELQQVTSGTLEEHVQVTELQINAETHSAAISRATDAQQTEPLDAVFSSMDAESIRAFENTRQALLSALADITHIPSERSPIRSVYDARPPVGWSAPEVPYFLDQSPALLEHVNTWFSEDFGTSPIAIERAAFAFRLVSSRGGVPVNLAAAGRGIQTVLPVAALLSAMATQADAPSIAVIEEPEAHVHPSAHGAVADLLIGAAASRQLIVETHSENLILRLRRRIAEGVLDSEALQLYFVDDDNSVHSIAVDETGGVVDWPQGVFEYDIIEARAIVEAKMRAMGSTES